MNLVRIWAKLVHENGSILFICSLYGRCIFTSEFVVSSISFSFNCQQMMSLSWGFLVLFPWEAGVYLLWPDQPHDFYTFSRPNFLKVCYIVINWIILYPVLYNAFVKPADFFFFSDYNWPHTQVSSINLAPEEGICIAMWRLDWWQSFASG